MFVGRIVPIWDLYGSYMGKKAYMGPMYVGPKWDKCPDSVHIGPIYTCLLSNKQCYFGSGERQTSVTPLSSCIKIISHR